MRVFVQGNAHQGQHLCKLCVPEREYAVLAAQHVLAVPADTAALVRLILPRLLRSVARAPLVVRKPLSSVPAGQSVLLRW